MLAGWSPPAILSRVDRALSGGAGVSRAAAGIGFGDHGQRLDVWRPDALAGTARPVLIFFYGGGWVTGTRQAYAFAARAFARHGFVVVVPDYRKVPAVRFPDFLVDGAQAVRWTRDHIAGFGGDPDRVALAGHSAGAYAVAMLALDSRHVERQQVAPGFVKAGLGLSGPYDFHPFTSQQAVDAMAHWPRPEETQPITHARADAPPLLLVTSSGDTVVQPRNAHALARALTAKGARASVREYPGLRHEQVVMALSRPFRRKAPVLADSAAFLNAALA